MATTSEFYIFVTETNYFRANDPLRVPVDGSFTVRQLLVAVVDIYGKPFRRYFGPPVWR